MTFEIKHWLGHGVSVAICIYSIYKLYYIYIIDRGDFKHVKHKGGKLALFVVDGNQALNR